MASMIPHVLAPETPNSERRMYELFRDKLPGAWKAIHGQRFLLPAKHRTREGELDFLLLDPARGALGLEVKGGRVERHADGTWTAVDRHGVRHDIKDPGKQASAAVHAIRKYMEDAPDFGRKGYWCRFEWGVVLPDIVSPPDMGPELPRAIVMDSTDLADPGRAVDRMFSHWTPDSAKRAPSDEIAKAFVSVLCERHPPASWLAGQFREESKQLLRLTEEQTRLLDSFAEFHRAAIRGAAGTGKTVLAKEKARRMALAGKRVLLLCFNEPLAAHLAREADGAFTVETFHDFCDRLARRAKLPFTRPKGGDKAARRFYEEEAPMLLLHALEQLPDERYDAVVVDEGQDFLPDWWPCLDQALADGREGTLYAFYDPIQNLHGGGPPEALKVLPFQLSHNCRNTRRIAEYTARQVRQLKVRQTDAKIMDEVVVRPGTPKGAKVEKITCRSDAEVVQKVGERIEQLVDKGRIEPDRIAIISTRRREKSPFAAHRPAGRFALRNLDESRSGSAGAVVFDTLHRCKGLEWDVVILLDLPNEHITARDRARQRYIAASRARHLLVVVRLQPEPAIQPPPSTVASS